METADMHMAVEQEHQILIEKKKREAKLLWRKRLDIFRGRGFRD